MSESSLDLINEYKDQIRILKSEVAELQDAGKSKDAANKRCLQKLEFSNKDLEDSQIKVKELESVAELKLAERMANGEVEFKKAVIDSHKGDWKDEFCLILISIPLLLLAWSVFSDDPNIQAKIDIFFNKFSNLPMFYQALVVGAFSTILGIKGVSTFKKK